MLPDKQVLFNYIEEGEIYEQQVVSNGLDLLFDFATGEFITIDGKIKIADKIERVKHWIEKAIKTDAYVNRLYRHSHYGMYTDKIVGYVYDKNYVDALMQQEIRYLMQLCKDIADIRDIEIQPFEDELLVKYTVMLTDGNEFDYEGVVIMSA